LKNECDKKAILTRGQPGAGELYGNRKKPKHMVQTDENGMQCGMDPAEGHVEGQRRVGDQCRS
jgi:hypothetical protein